MSSRELSPEWVLSSFISPLAGSHDEISELVVVARRLWPRIQAHAHREQPEKSSDEALALATEVWEGVLQSVAKTIQRSHRRNWRIKNTEAYLFGAFHHRFNRFKKRAQKTRDNTVSPFDRSGAVATGSRLKGSARSGGSDPGQRGRSEHG